MTLCCRERGCGAVRGKGRGEVSDGGEVKGSWMDGGGVAEGWSWGGGGQFLL